MKPVENDPGRLQKHMASTYVSLRLGIAIAGGALPLLLWLGGRIIDGEPLRASMSKYYYSDALGDVFVGALCAVGARLYLYKGFSTRENWALNLAGVFAVLVALVPTSDNGNDRDILTWHGSFAVLFFLCIVYVCVFRASDTLSLISDKQKAKQHRNLYRVLGFGMLGSPLGAVVLTGLLGSTALTFFVEALAVLLFAAYWLTKTKELSATNAELLALEAKLKAPPTPPPDSDRPGRLVQVKP